MQPSGTRCSRCSSCPKGLIATAGCIGKQNTVCQGTVSHSAWGELLAGYSSIISFSISGWHPPDWSGLSLKSAAQLADIIEGYTRRTTPPTPIPSVIIRILCDDGGLEFDPQSVTINGWQYQAGLTVPALTLLANVAVIPKIAGVHEVRFEIDGYSDW